MALCERNGSCPLGPNPWQALGVSNAAELSATILAALAEARAGADDENGGSSTPPGSTTPVPVERGISDAGTAVRPTRSGPATSSPWTKRSR